MPARSSGGISLEPLKIAAAGPGSANSKLNVALTKGGLTYKDSQNVNMSYPQQVAALTSKAIDASITTEPSFVENAVSKLGPYQQPR
jgi:ABC-type nitrate/sulfonate/bicarbonate transport system substrate-binding protein